MGPKKRNTKKPGAHISIIFHCNLKQCWGDVVEAVLTFANKHEKCYNGQFRMISTDGVNRLEISIGPEKFSLYRRGAVVAVFAHLLGQAEGTHREKIIRTWILMDDRFWKTTIEDFENLAAEAKLDPFLQESPGLLDRAFLGLIEDCTLEQLEKSRFGHTRPALQRAFQDWREEAGTPTMQRQLDKTNAYKKAFGQADVDMLETVTLKRAKKTIAEECLGYKVLAKFEVDNFQGDSRNIFKALKYAASFMESLASELPDDKRWKLPSLDTKCAVLGQFLEIDHTFVKCAQTFLTLPENAWQRAKDQLEILQQHFKDLDDLKSDLFDAVNHKNSRLYPDFQAEGAFIEITFGTQLVSLDKVRKVIDERQCERRRVLPQVQDFLKQPGPSLIASMEDLLLPRYKEDCVFPPLCPSDEKLECIPAMSIVAPGAIEPPPLRSASTDPAAESQGLQLVAEASAAPPPPTPTENITQPANLLETPPNISEGPTVEEYVEVSPEDPGEKGTVRQDVYDHYRRTSGSLTKEAKDPFKRSVKDLTNKVDSLADTVEDLRKEVARLEGKLERLAADVKASDEFTAAQNVMIQADLKSKLKTSQEEKKILRISSTIGLWLYFLMHQVDKNHNAQSNNVPGLRRCLQQGANRKKIQEILAGLNVDRVMHILDALTCQHPQSFPILSETEFNETEFRSTIPAHLSEEAKGELLEMFRVMVKAMRKYSPWSRNFTSDVIMHASINQRYRNFLGVRTRCFAV